MNKLRRKRRAEKKATWEAIGLRIAKHLHLVVERMNFEPEFFVDEHRTCSIRVYTHERAYPGGMRESLLPSHYIPTPIDYPRWGRYCEFGGLSYRNDGAVYSIYGFSNWEDAWRYIVTAFFARDNRQYFEHAAPHVELRSAETWSKCMKPLGFLPCELVSSLDEVRLTLVLNGLGWLAEDLKPGELSKLRSRIKHWNRGR